jgi:hypothetical protein
MTSPTTSNASTFSHPTLTPIVGKPTSAAIKLLTRELYANARSVHSTRGGGANGYLAVCMPTVAYVARAGEAFDVPDHPGPQPVHGPNATSAQITASNRQYDHDLREFETYNAINEALRKQLLEAVAAPYYNVLEDDTFGYADVTIVAILLHFNTETASSPAPTLKSIVTASALLGTPMRNLPIYGRESKRFDALPLTAVTPFPKPPPWNIPLKPYAKPASTATPSKHGMTKPTPTKRGPISSSIFLNKKKSASAT